MVYSKYTNTGKRIGGFNMNIVLGKHIIDMESIQSIEMHELSSNELDELEIEFNGEMESETIIKLDAMDCFSNFLTGDDRKVLGEHWNCIRLGGYDSKYQYYIEFGKFAENENLEYDVSITVLRADSYDRHYGIKNEQGTYSLTKDLLPLLEKILTPTTAQKKKGFFAQLLSDYEVRYEDLTPKQLKDLTAFYKKYSERINALKTRLARIAPREKVRNDFLTKYSNKSMLTITFTSDLTPLKFIEGDCGFDISEKYIELVSLFDDYKKKQEKANNSTNDGEKAVDYALKWFIASNDDSAVQISANCESKYRYNCIVLCKPDFIDEPQEYDHILVCSAGVVLIETKHWKGTVEIRSDGKWTRKMDADSSAIGIDSPKFQMRRHEVLMQKILPTIPVHSLLCFSNASTIIDGRENFKDYPIITVDQLEETLTYLCTKGTYTKEDVDRMVTAIDAHKVYKV